MDLTFCGRCPPYILQNREGSWFPHGSPDLLLGSPIIFEAYGNRISDSVKISKFV